MTPGQRAEVKRGEALPCRYKLAFESREDAQTEADRALFVHAAKLRTYRCPHCRMWHLASHRKGKGRNG